MQAKWFLFTGLLALSTAAQAQFVSAAQEKEMQKNLYYLASDKLEGRAPGTKGETLASDYIAKKFAKAGLTPGGENGGWFNYFEFSGDAKVNESCMLHVYNKSYKLHEDFWPLSSSANSSIKGMTRYVKFGIQAPENQYNDYAHLSPEELKGHIFVMEISTPDGVHPHSAYLKYADLGTRVQKAEEMGAAGVIFIDNYKNAEEPSERISKNVTPSRIPVVFAKGPATKVLTDGGSLEAAISVNIERSTVKARNVIGVINNHAPNNVIIGAHYDHLGWGEEGSLHRGEKAIHNGADDNASGTVALIAIAEYLAKNGPKNNNYVFVAFSAEEKGLFGSSAYTRSALFDPANTNYMLNMDMVGRLENDEIAVNGAGTSSMWGNNLNAIKTGNLKLKTSESGVGPSDHTSFYLKNVPVLHFFTGSHNDYHKPSDDADKINYDGLTRVTNFIIDLVVRMDAQGRIDFQKTKEQEQTKAPRFSVTLGIVPDYMYDGEGVRMDGVSDGKAAARAGMQAGDVLLELGGYKVTDMMGYMEALGKFKKGDKVKATVLRNGESKVFDVEF